jgi:hypothetical protein
MHEFRQGAGHDGLASATNIFWPASPKSIIPALLTIQRHDHFQTVDASKESLELVASLWILSDLTRLLCILIAVTRDILLDGR